MYLHGLLSVHTFFRWCLGNRKLSLARMLAFSLFVNKIRLDSIDADDLVLGL